MTPDQNRVRTFLSYKGFQWEPLALEEDTPDGPMDFIAHWEGTSSFRGTVISIGTEHHDDRSQLPDGTAVPDEKQRHRQLLADGLKGMAQRYGATVDGSSMPLVAVIVNHAPGCPVEDLSGIFATLTSGELAMIHLLIWFDDVNGDRMLFSQTDPDIYRKLYNWFHVA